MKIHFHAGTCIQMFIAILFVTAPNWKPAKYPVMNEWLNELGFVCPYNDIVARFKRTMLLIQVKAWIDGKGII